eukprot:g14862.t1
MFKFVRLGEVLTNSLFAIFILSLSQLVQSFLYLTVPNPFTDTGRGCRVYYFEKNEQLLLREVPWECSVVFFESQFWKESNITLLEKATKREEIHEISNVLAVSCGDSQSLRTFATHPKLEVCLFVDEEGGIGFTWLERFHSPLEASPKSTNIRRRGFSKLYWPGRRLSRDPKGLYLVAGFDGDSFHIVATSRYNNHILHAEVFVDDILDSYSSDGTLERISSHGYKNGVNQNYFLMQQTVNDVPRLSPENYRAWFTGPGRYKHLHGRTKRPGTQFVRSGADQIILSDQKLQNSSVDHSSVPVNQTIAVGAYNEEDRSNAHIEENVLNPTIDAAFGINSGGYEPDDASKNLQEETLVLEKAMELFKNNKLQEAKTIYERILKSRRLNHANSHNTQAARFNMGSVLYRLHSYTESVQYFHDLIRDHPLLIQIEAAKPLSSQNKFEYMTVVYNLVGDMLFYRSPNVGKGLEILKFAKAEVHGHDIKMMNHIYAIIQKWALYWKAVAQKNNNHQMALANAGTLLYEIGRNKEAKKMLQRVQKLNPKHSYADAYFNYAMIEIYEKRYSKARKFLGRYTKLKKKSYRGWLWRGKVVKYDAKNAKDLEASLRFFERAIKINPKRHDAYVEAITMLRERGNQVDSSMPIHNDGSGRSRQDNDRHTFKTGKITKLKKLAIANGALQHPEQLPSHFVKGLPSQPWYSRHDLFEMGAARTIHILENGFNIIREEVMKAFENGDLIKEGIDDTEGLTTMGKWTEVNMYHLGRKFDKNCNLLPQTTAILEKVPEIVSQVKGATKISVLQPHTKIREHNGPSNTRLRLHLGIKIPAGASITVGGIKKTWEEGKVLAFDDSFLHSVEHTGKEPRIALIADIWHPLMTEEDIIKSLRADEVERYLYRQSLYSSGTGASLAEEVVNW